MTREHPMYVTMIQIITKELLCR
jgi:hypothetical protein